MDCSCVYVCDYDPPEFCNSSIRLAQKEHRCGECGSTIKAGDEYEHVAGKWDGRLDTHKTCMVCREIRTAFFCDGWIYGAVLEYLCEHIDEMNGEIASDCIAGLSPAARDKVCDLIEEYWEMYEDDDEEE